MFNQFHLPCSEERNEPVAGMHLAVCRGFVEAMGGEIAAANRTDRTGAVFTITFPART
jgi:two-component system sensor histidine kinase KdpD